MVESDTESENGAKIYTLVMAISTVISDILKGVISNIVTQILPLEFLSDSDIIPDSSLVSEIGITDYSTLIQGSLMLIIAIMLWMFVAVHKRKHKKYRNIFERMPLLGSKFGKNSTSMIIIFHYQQIIAISIFIIGLGIIASAFLGLLGGILIVSILSYKYYKSDTLNYNAYSNNLS